MPEEVDPTLDTSTAASADESMEVIATAITSAMGIVGSVIGDPCANKTGLFNRMMFATRLNNALIAGTTWWAGTSQNKVRAAMANWGRGARGSAGGRPFGTYLINHYTVDLPGRVGFNLVNGRGNDRPSGLNQAAPGHPRLGPGVYVGPNRTLQGSVVARAWDEWAHKMRTQWVYATSPARPLWRERLESWVGRTRDDWRIWVPGDPVSPDSRIGRNWIAIENLRAEHEAVSADCERRLETARQMGLAQSETEQGMIAAGLEQGLAEETTERTQVITLALAAFGATWLLTRGRR